VVHIRANIIQESVERKTIKICRLDTFAAVSELDRVIDALFVQRLWKMNEIEFQTSDEKVQDLTKVYGLVLLQLSLHLKRFAQSGDVEAVTFFTDAFDQMSAEAKRILRTKLQ
jgi:hypothetical protein